MLGAHPTAHPSVGLLCADFCVCASMPEALAERAWLFCSTDKWCWKAFLSGYSFPFSSRLD